MHTVLAATWTNSRRRPELAGLNWPARSWKRKDGPLIVADGYTGSAPPTFSTKSASVPALEASLEGR